LYFEKLQVILVSDKFFACVSYTPINTKVMQRKCAGGGLTIQYGNIRALTGIVSFGAANGCTKNYPTVFA
jgi:hypothetical protein